MFSGIKFRIISIYMLLVLICMGIVGSFLVNRLEVQQIDSVTESMNETINSIVSSSDYMYQSDWQQEDVGNRIQETIEGFRYSGEESMYVIAREDAPFFVASSVNTKDLIRGTNALSSSHTAPELIVEAYNGKIQQKIVENSKTGNRSKHLAVPILSSDGDVKGILYMKTDLEGVYSVIDETKRILTYATGIGIVITAGLGFIIANSITGPIRDVTKKAKEMAEGNYKQKVEVKSDDEIGQLAKMFNYLTQELQETIGKMDIERSKLDTIFNYMAEGVIAVDRQGALIHANPTAREILDIHEEDVEQGEVQDLKRLNITDINYYDSNSLEGESQMEIDSSYYNVKYAPYRDESGANTGLIVVLQDITKEHALDMMRKEFVANVSHELKTPITTIKSYVETLISGELSFQEQQRFLSIIERESDRMVHLVRDLLQLSNMDYSNITLDKKSINVYEKVSGVLEGLDFIIKEKSQKIRLDIPVDTASIYGDPHGVEQILVNIISNAVKYTPAFGEIQVSGKNFANRVIVTVSDTGVGIPPKDMKRIFERFYRVEKGRSREMGGTGLGLAIAKEVMESMDGKISISSTLGEGTQVKLSFPAYLEGA